MSSRRFNGFVDALFQGRGFGEPGQRSYYATPATPAFLSAFRAGRAEVWLVMHDPDALGGVPTREQKFADDLRRQYPSVRFRDASPLLLAMREIKSPAELTLIQRAIDITAEAQKAAMTRVLTATHEYRSAGDDRVHVPESRRLLLGIPVDRRLRPEFDDAALREQQRAHRPRRTAADRHWRRSGRLLCRRHAHLSGERTRFRPSSVHIYDVVLAAQNESLTLMRPGRRHVEVNDKAIEVVGRELLKLGLVTKNTAEQAGLYLFHGTGHPLGLQTHDVYDRMRTVRAGHGLHE